jgi:hypothetical protein
MVLLQQNTAILLGIDRDLIIWMATFPLGLL